MNPPWTPAMQSIWDRAMHLARTRRAYGCAFPMPGTSFQPPSEGSMLIDVLFACIATDAEYEAHLTVVREDMVAWKAGVKSARPALISNLDVSKLEFKL